MRIEEFLAGIRAHELTIKKSVELWCVRTMGSSAVKARRRISPKLEATVAPDGKPWDFGIPKFQQRPPKESQ